MRSVFSVALLTVAGACWAGSAPPADIPSSIATVRQEIGRAPGARPDFEAGVLAWNESRFLSARNHWVRAAAWIEKSLPADGPARGAIGRLVEEADRLSQPEPDLDPSPVPAPTPHRHASRLHRAKRKSAVASAKKVMEHARAAQRAGQTEKAARLMRIASTLPGGEEAAEQADRLEREAISGSGSGW